MQEAEYCHRISLMYAGKMIALGSPKQLRENLAKRNSKYESPTMEDVFVETIEEAEAAQK